MPEEVSRGAPFPIGVTRQLRLGMVVALHVGYGGGMRIWGQNGMIAKFEIGNSKDGIRLYFVLNKEL